MTAVLDPPGGALDARTGLRRSNAKLRKRAVHNDPNSNLRAISSPNLLQDPPEGISSRSIPRKPLSGRQLNDPRRLHKSSRPSSSMGHDKEASRSRLHLPFRVKPEPIPELVLGAEENEMEQGKKGFTVSSLAQKIKTTFSKSKNAPPDNFTRWDDRLVPFGRYGFAVHPSTLGRTAPITNFGAIHESGSIPSTPVSIDPFDEAALAQHVWSRKHSINDAIESRLAQDWGSERRSRTVDGRPSIPSWNEVDWDTLTPEQIEVLIERFEQTIPSLSSPTDSGIDLEAGIATSYTGKGKSPAKVDCGSSHSPNLIDLGDDEIDDILAQELSLAMEMRKHKEQMSNTHQEWADRLRAIAYLKLERSERKRQAEEDMRQAQQLQEEDERLAIELASSRTCVCCSDSKHPLDFPARPATSQCQHSSQTCTDCMHEWLASEFDTKGCEDIHCAECPATLAFDDVKRLASEATFTAYEKLLTRTALSSLPEFAWCLSPTCNSGQLNTEDTNFSTTNYMECVECGYKQCLSHRVAWHTGETCQQYSYRTSGQKARDDEAKTAAMIDGVSKPCPGPGCGWRIQKIDGCDHMTCKKCKFEWCWECRASHREIKRVGNTAHQSWCKFHSENLNVAWPFNVH